MKVTISGVTFDKGSYAIIWMNDHIYRISGWGYDEDEELCWACVLRTQDGNILVFKDYDNTKYQVAVLEHGEPVVWWDLNMFDMYRLGAYGETNALSLQMERYMAEFKEETSEVYHYPDAEEVLENAKDVVF